MRVELSREAAERLEMQVRYLQAAGAPGAAERLSQRIMFFLEKHLARFPRTGRWLRDADLWEVWIPGTRLVVWYRLSNDVVVVVTVWHASQDRSGRRID
jgi:plasmid stabilization system protein ParE